MQKPVSSSFIIFIEFSTITSVEILFVGHKFIYSIFTFFIIRTLNEVKDENFTIPVLAFGILWIANKAKRESKGQLSMGFLLFKLS